MSIDIRLISVILDTDCKFCFRIFLIFKFFFIIFKRSFAALTSKLQFPYLLLCIQDIFRHQVDSDGLADLLVLSALADGGEI